MNKRDSAFQLPVEPYPGLRPFLDHEAALLHGRGRQVAEVIARLRVSQFVAVVGGSGSGKSSLIRAGVVPELRGFGLPDAGDYWITTTFTPGTTGEAGVAGEAGEASQPVADANATVDASADASANAQAGASAGASAQASAPAPAQTPISRLAWKFAQSLKPAEEVLRKRSKTGADVSSPAAPVSPEREEARRRDGIATVFRQSGFARLVDGFSEELEALGPPPENARFLFVIDQFEELFHPNNSGIEDARTLIEAVIDHFFNPHPRVYVVLTMRSEHLASCACYLELPDAINKSMYLVRRLDDHEIREAIEGPAKYFLRLQQRRGAAEDAVANALPDDIVFEEAVIRRLLIDVGRIANDADHLPLLQHVLARMWAAACVRQGVDGTCQVPREISWPDLEQAVNPRSKRAPGWLRERQVVNCLRSSLENWAEAVYQDRAPEQQSMIDVVLRQLGYRDSNNGQYLQQRLLVDDPHLFEGVDSPRGLLRDLLTKGFLDTVNYLFWDDENPDCITLKVSHESFIRGWTRFRKIVDAEADRFEEFVSMLRKCAQWKVEENPELLLGPSELMRMDERQLGRMLTTPGQRREWFHVLLQYRDGERLATVEPDVDRFVGSSRKRRDAEERERRDAAVREQAAEAIGKRNRLVAGLVVVLASLLLPYAYFSWALQAPTMKSVENFAAARALVERRERSEANPMVGAAGRELDVLLEAAGLVEEAQLRVHENWLLRYGFSWLPWVHSSRRLLALSTSEAMVNGSLRALLTTALWRSTSLPGTVEGTSEFAPERRELDCIVAGPSGESTSLKGSLFLDIVAGRGVFVAAPVSAEDQIDLYAALFSGGRCIAGRAIWSAPRHLNPLLMFDARARYMALSLSSPDIQPSVSLYSIDWERGLRGRLPSAQIRPRSVVVGAEATDLVRREVDPPNADGVYVAEAKSVTTWNVTGGIVIAVAGKGYRIFDEDSHRLATPGIEEDWADLRNPGEDSECKRLEDLLRKKEPQGFSLTMLEHGDHCFEIQRGNPPVPKRVVETAESVTSARSGGRPLEQVLVAVYEKTALTAAAEKGMPPVAPIAAVAPFGRFRPNYGEWVIGQQGRHDGWIAWRRRADDNSVIYNGAPWSTTALKRLGMEVRSLSSAPEPAGFPASAPPEAAGAKPASATADR